MQEQNEITAEQFQAIEQVLTEGRLSRYLGAASKDREKAFRLYVWNSALSEAFYFPLQMAEIAARNAIHKALIHFFGENWFENPKFKNHLFNEHRISLEKAVYEERAQHGDKMTAHHVTSALSFGFWDHLTTQRFAVPLWKRGIGHNFPHRDMNATLSDLNALIQSQKSWRNRVAHHQALFDKGPSKKYNETLKLIKWACPVTSAWVAQMSEVTMVIQKRPDGAPVEDNE